MDFRVKLSKAPFSSRKAKYVLDLIRGMNVNRALETLEFCRRRPAHSIRKLIRSCLANVDYLNEQDSRKGMEEIDADSLMITEARADEGPLVGYARRWVPRARGMSFPLNLRTCHIKLMLSAPEGAEEEEIEEEVEEEAEAGKGAVEEKGDEEGEEEKTNIEEETGSHEAPSGEDDETQPGETKGEDD
jgi:large subunit ribosomal protein L22